MNTTLCTLLLESLGQGARFYNKMGTKLNTVPAILATLKIDGDVRIESDEPEDKTEQPE